MVLEIVSLELLRNKVSHPCGEAILPMSSVISQPKHLTLPVKISIRKLSAHTTQRHNQACSSSETVLLVVLLVQHHSVLCTLSISQEPDLPLMSVPEEIENSQVLLTASSKLESKELETCTTVLEFPLLELLHTELRISERLIPVKSFYSKIIERLTFYSNGVSLKLSQSVQESSPIHLIPLEEDS
jgi:hypothetical protein